MGILERAAFVPLTASEIDQARQIISFDGVCVAHIQRQMRVGWNRAADLAEAIVGIDALPDVAKNRYQNPPIAPDASCFGRVTVNRTGDTHR
jgi:hypothetical protein